MPRSITQYRVFIGSPGGLQEEREQFRLALDKFSRNHCSHRGVTFEPVGWEDTIGGVGRPQELINEDLDQCDYAVFVLHDRWGSPTGSGHTSGTEEEWKRAEKLYKENELRNIALFFKNPDPGKLADPGSQLAQVTAFKTKIESEKRYLFKSYDAHEEFLDTLDRHLAQWLALGTLGRSDDAIAVYNDVIARFGSATEPALSEQVAKAQQNQEQLSKTGKGGRRRSPKP